MRKQHWLFQFQLDTIECQFGSFILPDNNNIPSKRRLSPGYEIIDSGNRKIRSAEVSDGELDHCRTILSALSLAPLSDDAPTGMETIAVRRSLEEPVPTCGDTHLQAQEAVGSGTLPSIFPDASRGIPLAKTRSPPRLIGLPGKREASRAPRGRRARVLSPVWPETASGLELWA